MKSLLISHNAKDSGGIQAVCRLLASQASNLEISKVVDLRRSTLTSSLYSRISDLRFLRIVHASLLIILFRPRVIICTHINQVRLLKVLRYRGSLLLICHGGEVWTNPLVGVYAQSFKIIFLCVSNFTANQICDKYLLSSEIIKRLHLTSELFTRIDSPGDRNRKGISINILTVSRLEKSDRYKGVDTAIIAVSRLLKKFPQMILTVIGTGDDFQYYRDLIEGEALQKNIKLLGFVSFERLIKEYRESDLFLLPGRPTICENGSEGEGFGIVFIEAGYFGIPSIGGSGDGAEEAILDGISGLLVNGFDVLSVQNGIEKLISNTDLRGRMSMAARENSLENHSLEKFISDFRMAVEAAYNLH